MFDIDLGDPAPGGEKNQQERADYMARVSGFYKDILENKINQMISNSHNCLEDSSNTIEEDRLWKSVIYVCREFKVWGESCIGEHVGNRVEIEEEKNLKKEIKNLLN